MSETFQDLKDIPQEFFKDGTQFLNRCTKRESTISKYLAVRDGIVCRGCGRGWLHTAVCA